MERKIGETFEFEGKTYKAVLAYDYCKGCAFDKGSICLMKPLDKLTGYCRGRNDTLSIIFKEIKDMEIKDNKLIISTPKGMEIDVENSDLKAGVIKFKEKELTYEDIDILLGGGFFPIQVSLSNYEKLVAIDKLMDIAKYYNGDWKPNWSNNKEGKFYISYNFIHNGYFVIEDTSHNVSTIVFKHEEDAQAVIDNSNFREILDAIFKN